MKKKISIIGSSGSVGSSAVSVILNNPDLFEVDFLVAKNNYLKLAQQAIQLNAKMVILEDEKNLSNLKELLVNTNISVLCGSKEITNAIILKQYDMLILASSGTCSIKYFDEAIKIGATIGIANKESIVCAWDLLKPKINKFNAKIIPLDSEHSSIYQILENTNYNKEDISSIIITGSGGSFIDFSLEQMENISIDQAIKHPNWSMGAKISIDSSTFMNKALEFMEAVYLFDVLPDKVEVVIHRKSILHGGVSFIDGTFIGNFSTPSMELPVAYALGYPKRIKTNNMPLSLINIAKLEFEELDENKFESIKLAKYALKQGGNTPAILNISNEIAVNLFLNKKISFINIMNVIKYTLDVIPYGKIQQLEDVDELYKKIQLSVSNYMGKLIN
jgi:1-deoxy-D-xylulose-5-phosphate reductoisomerase